MTQSYLSTTAECDAELLEYNRRVTQSMTQSYAEKDSLCNSAVTSVQLCGYLCATLRLPLCNSAVTSAYLCGYKKILVGGLTISVSSHSLLG